MRIDTERLRLRAFVEDDHAAIVAAMNEWAVAQWLGSPPYPYSDENARQWIALVQRDHDDGRPGRFAVAAPETDALIGCVSVEDRADGAELGYWLSPAHWGHGYATEASMAVVAHAFGAMGCHRLIAHTDPDNTASNGVLQKCGFRQLGLVARPETRRGKTELLRHELFAGDL